MSIVFIVSAPSGSGKSTLVAKLLKMVDNLDFSISYTTRAPRRSEHNRKEYFFVSREEFEAMVAAGEFLEHADVFGNYYGTARRFLREAEVCGHDLLLDIDVQGASQIMQKIPDAVSIFILPPDWQTLESRLRNRGSDAEEVIRRRLDTARREIENYCKYDYILVNDLLEQSTDQLKDIVLAERLKEERGTDLSGVSDLSNEDLSEEERHVIETAQACRLEEARERVQPIVASFNPQLVKGS